MNKKIKSRRIVFAFLVSFLTFASFASVSSASVVTSKVLHSTESEISIQVNASASAQIYVEYGYQKSKYSNKTSTSLVSKGQSKIFILPNLKSGSKIYYRIRYAILGRKSFSALSQSEANTSSKSDQFVFAVQADPHMDQASSAEVYAATIDQIVKAKPAFLMDLGDIFMTDKIQDKTEGNIRARFALMKGFYDKLNGIPLYITLGNHDGELGYSNFNTKKYREEYFPKQTGDLAYYSFTTPDSLHVVLDIFTYTTSNPKDDGWQWTLGKTQYEWLKRTLETSNAEHKFVYIHHLLYGNAQSRGGVEIAKYNEWGGQNNDGTEGFMANRPGWEMPVHNLLVKHGVDFVFKGHDHIYVKQELDGIIYQTLPQPSHPGEKINSAAEYGYISGKVIGGSGFLKLTTSKNSIKVEFIKHDGTILDSYSKGD